MDINREIKLAAEDACRVLFKAVPQALQLQPTNPSFEGSHTLVCFPLSAQYRQKPDEIALKIGKYLLSHSTLLSSYNVVKGFLNLTLTDAVWLMAFDAIVQQPNFGVQQPTGKEIVIEISSPNTNKPLHLGHLRNNFLGASISALYKAFGYRVHKVQIINDRGIHICKSMATWKRIAAEETPRSTSMKGDKLVGKYYVVFNTIHKREVSELVAGGVPPEQAEKEAPIMQEAIHMLRRWEEKDSAVRALWKNMNEWVYSGFEVTYKRMGVTFDKLYFESETYLLGKREILQGLERGIFYSEQDGSVWVDLTAAGMDKKVLLRSDGTSMYITQDIGTAICRYRDFPNLAGQIYTVGNEQEYHFKVLFLILARLGYTWADKCYHLSYGMVDLPSGKMKSREGTVVDADDLMEQMVEKAKQQTYELGKIDDMDREDSDRLFEILGIGAIKYYLLKVDPHKRMVFNPNESIQLQGNTGPFVQYTYARIRSLLRKSATIRIQQPDTYCHVGTMLPPERMLIRYFVAYPGCLREAFHDHNPSVLVNYVYDLAKAYNRFYQTIAILSEEDSNLLCFRIALSEKTAEVVKKVMDILCIDLPERM